MTGSAAVGIICKTPRAGASKTRLLSVLSGEAAAELAGCFLADVAATINAIPQSIGRQGYAVYAPEGSETELRRYVPPDFNLLCRRDATLGVVLLGATTHLLAADHDCVVLVNADSPTLPQQLLTAAIAALRAPGERVVLGPATDGGYYLIGLKRAHARLFADIPWSTPAVLDETLARAAEIGLAAQLLTPWYDVDDAASLASLIIELRDGALPPACVSQGRAPAASTRQWLERHFELTKRVDAMTQSLNAR